MQLGCLREDLCIWMQIGNMTGCLLVKFWSDCLSVGVRSETFLSSSREMINALVYLPVAVRKLKD